MCGALVQYLTTENKNFQPMGANMGILPPLPEDKRPATSACVTWHRPSALLPASSSGWMKPPCNHRADLPEQKGAQL